MLRLSESQTEITVVNDQWTRPTYAADAARAIRGLVERNVTGVMHVTNAGSATWAEFAKAVFSLAGKSTVVRSITTEEYPDKTPRPKRVMLSTALLEGSYNIKLPHWENALGRYLTTIEAIA